MEGEEIKTEIVKKPKRKIWKIVVFALIFIGLASGLAYCFRTELAAAINKVRLSHLPKCDGIDDKEILFKCWGKRAELNEAEAQCELGKMYKFGQGVPIDYGKAFEWYSKAAKQGNVNAQNELGTMYNSGMGVNKDYSKAVEWYTEAANQGWEKAQLNLGNKYFSGQGVAQNYSKAFEWYTKAAEQGSSDAQLLLGIMYSEGLAVTRNNTKAIEWYTKAAEQGNLRAQTILGKTFYYGHGVSQDYDKAYKWNYKAAEQGDEDAQITLGLMFYYGHGVPQDYFRAFEWARKSAEQGKETAQTLLGMMYAFGQGVKQDYEKSFEWYTKAAKQGYDLAQYWLALMYYSGQGTQVNFAEGTRWLKKAAKQHNEKAINLLKIQSEGGKLNVIRNWCYEEMFGYPFCPNTVNPRAREFPKNCIFKISNTNHLRILQQTLYGTLVVSNIGRWQTTTFFILKNDVDSDMIDDSQPKPGYFVRTGNFSYEAVIGATRTIQKLQRVPIYEQGTAKQKIVKRKIQPKEMIGKYVRTGDHTYTYKDKSGITHITTNKPPKGAEIIPYNYSGSTGRFRLNKR